MPKPKLPSLSEALNEALDPKKPKRATVAGLGIPDEPEPPSRGVTPPDPTRPVAPAKDFNKRANSLDKLALPAGLFPGASKSLYDALYVRTRGAIVPTRTIRATKRELCDWSGIRNAKTIDSHLRYFSAIGLVVSEWERGQNDGSLYEVLLPEETRGLFVGSRGVTPPNPMSPHLTPPDSTSLQNPGSPSPQNMGSPHLTDPVLESTTSGEPKTSFKTTTNTDDELMPLLRARVGKSMPKTEAVLLSILDLLESRTAVSSHDALLAHFLTKKIAHRGNTAQQRPNDEQFRGGPVAECSEEELAELRKIEADIRAELERG